MGGILITVCIWGLILGGAGIIIWFIVSHLGTVPEGYGATVRLFDRHRRVLGAGPYFLLPGEQKGPDIKVRQHQVTRSIPGIFTHGKLPVSVKVNLAMSLDLRRMSRDELYYSEGERHDQQVNIFQTLLRRLIFEIPPPKPGDPMRADLPTFFSPFLGKPLEDLSLALETRANRELTKHGVSVAKSSLVVDNLDIADDIVDAYTDLIASDFKGSARNVFMQRVRAAAPEMSEAALVQLYNAINDSPGDWHTIFASGTLEPRLYVTEQGPIISQPVVQERAAPARLPAPQPAPEGAPPAEGAPVSLHNYPLTSEDMALLKTFRD